MDYDFAVIGSGFGGSVAALRLAEKGYRVAVLEQGQWVTPHDAIEASEDPKKLFFMPQCGLNGFFQQTIFRHLGVVSGVGVGGGSLVYAAVLLKPQPAFYRDPGWNNLGVNWETELAPFYAQAARILGVTPNPNQSQMDAYLKETAELMGAAETFGPTPMGIYFGTPEHLVEDPFFDGNGPSRTGCHLCGECLTGCPHGAKNSLDKNYLYLAQKKGATILPERKVVDIRPLANGSYQLILKHPMKKFHRYRPLLAQKIVLAAGVLGTLELLFRCRDVTRTLPEISHQLGRIVRTNSEAIVGALSPDPDLDLSKGTTISSDFFPTPQTHITQNRFPKGYTFMKWYFGPLVDHAHPVWRCGLVLFKLLTRPVPIIKNWFAKNWHKRVTILTVMQNIDNQMILTYGRSLVYLFLKKRLKSVKVPTKAAPTNLPIANQAASFLGQVTGGTPLNVAMESMGNLSFTAHILGGCHMGTTSEEGVIDTQHRLFHYPGLYVVDGSSISANVGVNPSLTITALAERAMHSIPAKKEMPRDFLKNHFTIKKGSSAMQNLLKGMKWFFLFLFFNAVLTGINIYQNGGSYDGRTVAKILGRPVHQALLKDIAQLSKAEIMQLFYAAKAPEFSSLKGEYQAVTLPKGILAPAAEFFTHHFFGPGHWDGKAFWPQEKNRGWGYNLFSRKKENGELTILRARRMDTYIGASEIDGKSSFHLVYQAYNGGLVHSMHDEIRKINDRLYICMGYMAIGGGSINPAPFVLYGEPAQWVGIDG